ncbi:Fasciclin-like arabinogalactan protein 4 [Camellia lanceoleosa]|uniref:Fasciclin-like arabinogalactan protein 4 n=1 Tax=Camellia lanceoleosa TaxID=1840588 RepID=A0ACC0I502_9ERIC|nr:Fasciclin-like arabinogalactan protein 4 [Camellia lanceoleosa]
MGAGRFTLNISRVNGSVAIDTGIVQASVTQTVFDRNPVAILGFREFCSWILATDLIHSIERRFLAAQAESDWDDYLILDESV